MSATLAYSFDQLKKAKPDQVQRVKRMIIGKLASNQKPMKFSELVKFLTGLRNVGQTELVEAVKQLQEKGSLVISESDFTITFKSQTA